MKLEVSGQKYTDLYTAKFEMNIDADDVDDLLMINSVTNNMYQCVRDE